MLFIVYVVYLKSCGLLACLRISIFMRNPSGEVEDVVGYHGFDTERLHSSAHPSLVVANTQFSRQS